MSDCWRGLRLGSTLGMESWTFISSPRHRLGPSSRVVLLVTGDGLKTPGPVSHTYDPIMIEADADAFVEQVLVA